MMAERSGAETALTTLADALPYGIFLLDGEGCIVLCNKRAQIMMADADGPPPWFATMELSAISCIALARWLSS